MQEEDRERVRELLPELTVRVQDLVGMLGSKLGLVSRHRDLGRGFEADRTPAGAGFGLFAGEGGQA